MGASHRPATIPAMSFLGDLGGALLAFMYDNPVAIAIAGLAVTAVLLLAARRFRWRGRVARHPVAAIAASAVVLVVLAPVAWYLVSPVFIRTELVEPPVAAAAEGGQPAVASASPRRPTTTAPVAPGVEAASPAASLRATPEATRAAPTPSAWIPAARRSGTFQGTDDFHFGRGTATLTETAPGEYTIRLEDFSVRNGPDLYVYLSPARRDYADGAIEVAKLRATDGSFNVRVPAGTDPTGTRSVLIWCKQFSHLFAYATLES